MFPLILRLLSVCCTFPGPGRMRLNSVRIQLVIEICLLFRMSVRVLSNVLPQCQFTVPLQCEKNLNFLRQSKNSLLS